MNAYETSSWVLKVEDLYVTYKTGFLGFRSFQHEVLKGISFEINKGETLGIMGRNGCGKSTLLKVLAGVIAPTSGKLYFNGIKDTALLTLGLGFNGELSGRDNAMLSLMLRGYGKKQAREMLPGIVEFSELGDFIERPVKTYSSGMKSRLGFSVGVQAKTDLLLIDETLSVGDAHFKEKAQNVLLNKVNGDQTVVFISHSAGQVRKICDRAIWLHEGHVEDEGETSSVVKSYTEFMRE